MVEFLLSRGAATNLPDDEFWSTPLAWAERWRHAEIAEGAIAVFDASVLC
jgi:hypothetical protein